VLLTDAPGDFDEVWVNIASVEIESAEQGWITLTEGPQSFDLLTLQDDVTAALGGGQLPPGTYGQLRLIVDDAHVVVDSVSEELEIASGAQTGIKINLDATIEENMLYTLVLDFDAAKSVKSTAQGWLMTRSSRSRRSAACRCWPRRVTPAPTRAPAPTPAGEQMTGAGATPRPPPRPRRHLRRHGRGSAGPRRSPRRSHSRLPRRRPRRPERAAQRTRTSSSSVLLSTEGLSYRNSIANVF
jgi:hypothetical protein